MRKLGKSRKIGISVAVACCMLLAIIFSADIKNLFVLAADALSALISTEETTDTSNTIVMRTDDAYDVYETKGYYAFSVYAPSTATYTIGVTAENGSVRVNTGEAISVNGTEMSVSLTEGTNVLYIMGCDSPSIQWNRGTCDLEPMNKVCALLAGDLDQDGERTLLELLRLKKEAAVEGTLTTDMLARKESADIDRDNSVTDEDARLLRELLVGNPRYEASELRPVIVDAYLVDATTNTAVLYDTLADAFTAASTESTANSNKDVTVTVVNPTDVSMATRIDVDGGAQIILRDDGATDNGWCRTITRTSTLKEEMFAVGNGTLTLAGGSDSDENISLILDGGAISASSNHFVDVGNRIKHAAATLNMNAGVKLHNNVNTNNGGALAIQTTFNMNGGIISGNLSKGVGGAIMLLGAYDKNGVTLPAATMTMAGGIITENEAEAELYSSGGVSISGGATLDMTGGEIYNNVTPVSLDNNSVRKSGTTSVFTMGGSAYVDRVCFDSTSVDTYCVELTSKLTTTKDITLFFTQPLNEANPVVKRDSSFSECDALFKLSEHMVPCQLVQDDSNENLCLRSDVTDMETVVVGEKPVYSSNSDSAFQALEIKGSDWTVQGVCADDQYLYMAIAQSPSVGCRILKVKLGTWEYVDCSDVMLNTDHSNEMTYNPNTGKIYITHCISEGTGTTTKDNGPYAISIVDPDNLDAVESIIYLSDSSAYTGTTGISALAYNTTQDYYVGSGTGFRFGFLKGTTSEEDGTYSITETTMPSTGLKGFTGYTAYTKQGVYATDTTIYANTWYDITNLTGEEQNFLTIYDWSGNYHGTQYIVKEDGSAFTGEIESLFEYNGIMYMACFPKDYSVVAEVYALSDVAKAESTIEVRDSNGAVVDGVYTNLASAIAKANELGTATLILKDDVTVGAKQIITGNVTIKDDGTPRTIKRGAAYKYQMFEVGSSSASLTLQATGTDKDNPTLILDGNGVQKCSAMISHEKNGGTLSVTGPVKFTNAHINQNGGIIRTISGAANITIDGAVFTGNTVVTATLNGGLINVLGTSKVTIKDTVFDSNVISSSGAVMGAILYVNGGTANVVDSAFTSNITTTTENGGGLLRIDSGTLNIGKYTDEDGTTTVEGACTFEHNSFSASEGSEVYGGVIAIGTNASAQVYNSTFTSNTAEFGNISVNNGATLTIGDSELANNLTTSTTEPDSKDIRATGTSGKVIVEGKVKTTVYCNNSNKLQIGSQLEAGSEITITGRSAVIAEGNTLVSFTGDNAADVMADCKANGYLKVASEDYTLVYDTTDNTAKLANVVATIEEEKYASLEEAITAANELDSAIITLEADATVGETQEIKGNVTITDDGIARTITREEGFTNQMFVVADGAGLSFTATGEDKASPTLTIDGNGEVAGASGAMVSLGTGSGTLAVNNAVQFTNANINEDGGIIRTEAGSTAKVAIDGGVFANNTVAATDDVYGIVDGDTPGDVYGGLINVAGSAEVIISNALFEYNEISSAAGLVKGGILYVEGGTVNIVGSTFEHNTSATTSAGGGLLRIDSGTLNIGKYVNAAGETIEKDCYFAENTFTGSGNNVYGGVIALGNNANAQVYNSTFTSNTAELGNISINNGATLTIGDSELNNLTTSTAEPDSKDIRVGSGGTVIFEGKVNTTVYCVKVNSLEVNSQLTEDSEIIVTGPSSVIAEGKTVVSFTGDNAADVMADCKAKGYLKVASEDFTLVYDTTANTAKIASVVATIEEEKYASLADAIEAANALDSATIVLKADVTAGEMPNITGSVTITDDGTARTITREEGFTDQMFVVADGAGLTFTATGTDKTSPTLTIDGNGEVAGASGAMVSLGTGSGTLAVNNAVQFTNANINEDGGIIRTEDGSTAKVTINGGIFANNTAEVADEIKGGLINVLGTANVTISNALFQNNTISSTVVKGGIICLNSGTLNVVGSTFASNTMDTTSAGAGGVIAAYGGTLNIGKYVNVTNETIEGDCCFTDNTFTGNSYGGAIAISHTSAIVSIYNTTIQRNVAKNGGGVHLGSGTSLTIGDCTVTDNTTTNNGSARLDINNNGTVNLEGMMKATIFCSAANSLHVVDELETESEIKVGLLNHPVGKTVLTFESAEVMAVSQAYITYAKYAATGYTEHTEYILSYETTSDSQYIAKLASVVATIGEEKYASLADAIKAANELDSAIIVLKADATVGETQEIKGNVTITDDGTARTIIREEGFTDRMFEVADGAGLTFTATGTNNESPTLTIDGNGEVAGPSGAMVSLGTGSGTLTVNHAVCFTNANINEDGGIIRTGTAEEAVSTAKVTINGGVFANNTVAATDDAYGLVDGDTPGDVYGGLINVAGSAEVTIRNALFEYNEISSAAGLVKGGILYVEGGTVNIVGSTFASNTVETYIAGGGLLRIDSGTLNIGKYTDEDGTTTVEGACTFTNNSFTASVKNRVYGGVIALGDNASAQVYNSTFTLNTAELGNISLNKGATLTIGDSELANNITTSTAVSDVEDIRATGTSKVIVEGKVKTTVYCNAVDKLQIGSQLEAGSEITLTGSASVIAPDMTLVTFTGDNAAEVMADCKANGYLKVASEDYTLAYDTTDNTAKIASVVATIGEEKYASLEDAITAANALETTAESPATIVLKADVTVGATQTIAKNVTITDDGTAKTITRGADCTAQLFDVQETASLTLAGTGTLAEDSSTVQGTITVDGNKTNVTATTSMINNAGSFTLGTNASLINAGNADVANGGALYNTGTVALAGTLSGNEGGRGGAIYNSGGTVTFNEGTFSENKASVHGAVIMSLNGSVVITGGNFTSNTAVDRGGVILSNGATVTISGGEFSENTAEGTTGGGVYGGTGTAELTITGGSFSNNKATAGGGVIESNGAVTIKGGTYEENSAFEGGVFYMNTSGALTIEAGEFYSNTTTNATNAAGGVIYIVKNTLNITGGTFGAEGKGNVSYQRGGAIYIADRDTAPTEANISIKNATFSHNSAQHGEKASGGVLYVGKNSIVNIDVCTFGYNETVDTDTSTNGIYYLGAVIYAAASDVNVTNTTFNNNSTKRGGALYITGADVALSNCEFIDNKGTAFGRDIFYDKGSLTLSGKIGNAQIDKRASEITVKGELDTSSKIEIKQISGANGLVQVRFDNAAATEIGEQCITYYDYYSNINDGLTLQFDTENCYAIMK